MRILRLFGSAALDVYRRGGRAMWLAPALVALVVVPEFAQHVVEIRMGMFDSLAAARAHSDDALRWGFGYVKLAGFALAILGVARFWWCDASQRRAASVPLYALLRIALGVALIVLTGLPFDWLGGQVDNPMADAAVLATSLVVQSYVIVYLVGALLDDRTMTLRRLFPSQWRTALWVLLLLVLAYGPAFALHAANHRLALGAPGAAVWAWMVFDSLVVGLMAALTGTAFADGYARATGRVLAPARFGAARPRRVGHAAAVQDGAAMRGE